MFAPHDRAIIRDLAKQVAEVSEQPIMAARRAMWVRHHRLERVRPLILVFPEGSWRELLPGGVLHCEGERAREIEWALAARLYHHAHIHDDLPIEKTWVVHKAIANTGWGLEIRHKPSLQDTGAWAFDPVILEPADLKKLRFPEVTVDEAETVRRLSEAQDLFGDLLNVKLKGIDHISFHLMSLYCQLRGLEQVMWDMYDNPSMLHDAMRFLEEGNRRLVQQCEALNLFSLNNDETYHSSGGVGYSRELPASGFDPGHVHPADMWSSAEAQEMAQVGPEMHREFILAYEKRLLEPFGLNGYGCCEDLTNKLDDVMTIPHLRRISISPFADVDRCAEKLGNRFIFSWKPHPAHLVGHYDPAHIRVYIRHTCEVTRGGIVEMILKDTHTCENHPERFTQWTDIAQEVAAQF